MRHQSKYKNRKKGERKSVDNLHNMQLSKEYLEIMQNFLSSGRKELTENELQSLNFLVGNIVFLENAVSSLEEKLHVHDVDIKYLAGQRDRAESIVRNKKEEINKLRIENNSLKNGLTELKKKENDHNPQSLSREIREAIYVIEDMWSNMKSLLRVDGLMDDKVEEYRKDCRAFELASKALRQYIPR